MQCVAVKEVCLQVDVVEASLIDGINGGVAAAKIVADPIKANKQAHIDALLKPTEDESAYWLHDFKTGYMGKL